MSVSRGDTIKYSFTLQDLELIEEAVVTKVEGDKIYCKTNFNQKLIFDSKTKQCYVDNTTFGAKRTLIE